MKPLTRADLHLARLEALANETARLLRAGKDAVIVGPPGCGTSLLARRVCEVLVEHGAEVDLLDCSRDDASLGHQLAPRADSSQRILILDQLGTLELKNQLALLPQIRPNAGRKLWVGCIDTPSFRATYHEDFLPEAKAHLRYPALARDELLGLYKAIVTDTDSSWGEAIYYLAYDWCGDDLRLFESFTAEFYGDWTGQVYDQSVEERLDVWLRGSAIQAYRARLHALEPGCQHWIAHLLRGGKVMFHRPEANLETSLPIRRLFLSGFLSADLTPGYYQFRNLAAAYVSAEGTGFAMQPIEMLRRGSNARVNALLQDVEVALRAAVRDAVLPMQPGDWKKLLQARKSERTLFDPSLPAELATWIGTLGGVDQATAVPGVRAELARLEKKYKEENNTWSELQKRYVHGAAGGAQAPAMPESIAVDYMTFSELSEFARTKLKDCLFVAGRAGRLGEQISMRWNAHLALVNRLRNDAAHLRNISFQDMQELIAAVNQMRRDQINFGKETFPHE